VHLLPSGRNAIALVKMPTKPEIAKGCSGRTVSPGMSLIKAPLPKKSSISPPPRELERSKYIGKAGRSTVWLMSYDAVTLNPNASNATDATNPARGPAIAKSNKDTIDGGGDFNGVIAPNVPN